MKNKINAKIVADSIDIRGNRLITYVLTYPRMIHAEVMTHRMFSRNAASSRAIPFERMLKMVETDPFIPIAWQKDHKGMQGVEYFTDIKDIAQKTESWLSASRQAILMSKVLSGQDVTKQLCNRLLEPFMWYTALVTTTEYDNFFELRCPKYKCKGLACGSVKSKKDWLEIMQFSSAVHPNQYPKTIEDWLLLSESGAEIHIQALAEAMWDAMNESTPKQLKAGEWHIPFGDKLLITDISDVIHKAPYKEELNTFEKRFPVLLEEANLAKIKIATARCARLSYMTFDGEIDYEKDIALHDSLLANRHASAFEHCCRVLNEEEYNTLGKMTLHPEKGYIFEKGWADNIRGFISYRRILNI